MADKRWEQFKGDGKYVKFQKFGDSVQGVINKIEFVTKFGKDSPELTLRCRAVDPETNKEYFAERILTVGQANLQRQLAEDPPEEGDGIEIIYDHDEPGNPQPTKIFTVKITPRSMVGRPDGSVTRRPGESARQEAEQAPVDDFSDEPF